MTDKPIRLNDPDRDDDHERWLSDLWRERANPLARNGHALDEIFWGVVDAAIIKALQHPHATARISDTLWNIAEQNDRFGRSPDALQARIGDRFKAFERIERAKPLKKKPLEPTPFFLRDPALLKRRPRLFGNHLVRGQACVTLGRTTIGKTGLGIVEALSMASGRDLVDKPVEKRLRVWFIGEDNRDELELRFAAPCIHYNVTQEQLERYLFVDSRLDFENLRLVEVIPHKGVVVNEPLLEQLRATIKRNEIDVLYLDPLIKFHGVPESDNTSMEVVMFTITGLANELNIATNLLHHVRKQAQGNSGPLTIDDGRGASAIISAVRIKRILNPMSKDEATRAGISEADRRWYFNVTSESNINSPEKAEWYRSVPLALPCGESVGVIERWKFPDQFPGISEADLKVAQNLAQGGAYRESSQSPDWFGWALAKHLNIPIKYGAENDPADMARIKTIIKTWLRTNVLDIEPGEDARRKKVSFIIPGKALATYSNRPASKSDDDEIDMD